MSTDSVKSLTEMLADLHEPAGLTSSVPSKDPTKSASEEVMDASRKLSDFRMKPDDEKMAQVFEWRMRGLSPREIAKSLGVDPSTIYRWLSKYCQQQRQRIEQEPAANLITEHMMFYDRIEEYCLYEASQLVSDGVEIGKDGKVKRGDNLEGRQLKMKYLELSMKVRQAKVQLMISTGILPKEPERIYHSMSEEKRDDVGSEAKPATRSTEQIKSNILDLLAKGRVLDK